MVAISLVLKMTIVSPRSSTMIQENKHFGSFIFLTAVSRLIIQLSNLPTFGKSEKLNIVQEIFNLEKFNGKRGNSV